MYYWTKLNCKTENEKKNLERILKKNMSYFKQEFSDDDEDDGDVFLDDIDLGNLEKLNRKEFNVGEIIKETMEDMKALIAILKEMKNFTPENDEKVNKLAQLLDNNEIVNKKVIIFTEFKRLHAT